MPPGRPLFAGLAGIALSVSSRFAETENARVEWIDRGENSFTLRVNASIPSVLVASQTYYPGLKASIGGASVPVIPANYALSAISLPSGEHDVRFFYDPASIRIGVCDIAYDHGCGDLVFLPASPPRRSHGV
jgi:hypothetical protein